MTVDAEVPAADWPARLSRHAAGYSLLELLVVVGLIAGLALFLPSVTGGGKALALQSAQATVANLVTAARTKAPAINRKTRLLVNLDPTQSERYLRCLVLQVARQAGTSPSDWDTLKVVMLPPDTYVVPGALDGLVADSAAWRRPSDASLLLVSDLFVNQSLAYALEGDAGPQTWTGVAFTPNQTLAALGAGPPPKGTVVIAQGRRRAPPTDTAGGPPVELRNPAAVRGLLLSAYGVPALLDERGAF